MGIDRANRTAVDIAAAFRKKAASNKAKISPQKKIAAPAVPVTYKTVKQRAEEKRQKAAKLPLNPQIQQANKIQGGNMGLIDQASAFLKSSSGRQVLSGLAGGLQAITKNSKLGLNNDGDSYLRGGFRRRKSMNPTNFRAIRRAATRLNSYKRFSKRVDKTLAKLAR